MQQIGLECNLQTNVHKVTGCYVSVQMPRCVFHLCFPKFVCNQANVYFCPGDSISETQKCIVYSLRAGQAHKQHCQSSWMLCREADAWSGLKRSEPVIFSMICVRDQRCPVTLPTKQPHVFWNSLPLCLSVTNAHRNSHTHTHTH